MARLHLRLYVITLADAGRGIGHLDVVRAALAGGADALQLRDKGMEGGDLFRLAVEMREAVDASGADCLFLVNDRADVAVAAGADGVHLGQEDLPAGAARALVGAEMILGVSVGTVEEAVKAREAGADYLGVGPIFPTPSKPDAGKPIGLEGLRGIREEVDLPLVAIGGIDAERVEAVLEAGADGVAVISAVAYARDMEAAVRRLRRAVDSFRV